MRKNFPPLCVMPQFKKWGGQTLTSFAQDKKKVEQTVDSRLTSTFVTKTQFSKYVFSKYKFVYRFGSFTNKQYSCKLLKKGGEI